MLTIPPSGQAILDLKRIAALGLEIMFSWIVIQVTVRRTESWRVVYTSNAALALPTLVR